jgi:hypothetical protein
VKRARWPRTAGGAPTTRLILGAAAKGRRKARNDMAPFALGFAAGIATIAAATAALLAINEIDCEHEVAKVTATRDPDLLAAVVAAVSGSIGGKIGLGFQAGGGSIATY